MISLRQGKTSMINELQQKSIVKILTLILTCAQAIKCYSNVYSKYPKFCLWSSLINFINVSIVHVSLIFHQIYCDTLNHFNYYSQ